MPFSEHNGFKSRVLSIVFLFLNAVCIASPGIKNVAENYQQSVASQFGHELNNPGPEESELPIYSFKNHAVQISATPRNYACNENFYSKALPLPAKKCCKSFITASYFLPKPGYYTFLFRFKLF